MRRGPVRPVIRSRGADAAVAAAERRAAWRYGLGCGAAVALALLASLALPALPAEGAGWMLAMGCGSAALLVLAGLAWLSATRAPAPLPAALVHSAHVQGARIAALLAALHVAAALILEPALLADLRPTGPPAMLAGGGALVLMAWLASTAWRRCRPISEHRLAAGVHTLLAVAAVGLCLLHLLAQDHLGVGARRWFWVGVLALALTTTAWRRIRRRQADAAPSGPAPPLRGLARRVALGALLPIAGAVLVVALLG